MARQRIGRVLLFWLVLAQGASVSLLQAEDPCNLLLLGTSITDNGDGDGFADTHETVQIGISVQPHCTDPAVEELSDCVAWLSTESPAIDCMRRPEILIGDLPANGPAVTADDTFEIKIGSIDRQALGLGPDDLLEAALTLDIRCFDGASELSFREFLTLPLDLNVLDLGQTPTDWAEDFEGGGIDPGNPLLGTAFFAENIDAGLPGNSNAEGLANADGWRCAYSDPDWQNANSYNKPEGEACYPGVNLAQADAIFWQMDGSPISGTPDGGRAFRGEKSMYYGVFLGQVDEGFTTPLTTVESVATFDLINLGVGHPQLSFWQQVSLADHRSIDSRIGRNVDRGVVQILLHDAAGNRTSDWMNLVPIQNSYAQQAEDNYTNCLFDPVDDGNTEDDFFDPTDPLRDLGPSSTCFPSYSWSFMGSTTGSFSTVAVGNATTPPVLDDLPSLGKGTWVQAKIDLTEFRGRRARLRYLVTSLNVTWAETYVQQFGTDRDERDDGWWIDDVVIDETLAEPAVFTNDTFLLGSCSGTGEPCIGQCRSSLAPCSDTAPCDEGEGDCVIPCPTGEVCAGLPPDCGADCTLARVNAFVEPDGPLNPSSVITSDADGPLTVNLSAPFDLDTGAEPSWVDACIDGHREYRVCISGDPDGSGSGLPDPDCDDPWDSPVCESCSIVWSLDSMMSLSPDVVTTYATELRCSSVPECRDGRTVEVFVECPFGQTNTNGLREMRALDAGTLTWRGPLNVDWLRGSFLSGEEIGDYLADFTDSATYATAIPMDGDPPAGSGYYYLVKADGPASPSDLYFCGSKTWRSGGDAEVSEPARNSVFGNP